MSNGGHSVNTGFIRSDERIETLVDKLNGMYITDSKLARNLKEILYGKGGYHDHCHFLLHLDSCLRDFLLSVICHVFKLLAI